MNDPMEPEKTEYSPTTEALGKIAAGWGIDVPTDPNVIHAMAFELFQYRQATEGFPDLGSLLANFEFYDGASGLTPRDASRLTDILHVTGWLGGTEVYPRLLSVHNAGPIEALLTDVMNVMRHALPRGTAYRVAKDGTRAEWTGDPELADGFTFTAGPDTTTVEITVDGGVPEYVEFQVTASGGVVVMRNVTTTELLQFTATMLSALACATLRDQSEEFV